MSDTASKPIVLVTGSAGTVGEALHDALASDYRVIGMDRSLDEGDGIEVDLGSDESVADAFAQFGERFGTRIASVVHLAAYFDFSGEPHELYDKVNVQGTRRLMRALRDFDVEQVVYSGTMLVHAPTAPGGRIDERAPIEPRWAYPQSKADAERVIAQEAGRTPYVLLHLAGLYDDRTAVPTLAQQIARIHRRDLQGHLYAGDQEAGQAMLHRDDMVDAFKRAIDRRHALPPSLTLLVGEPETMGYRELQERLGVLLHGEDWATLAVPETLAKAGAWLQSAAAPLVPDAIDGGQEPFVKPFMIDLASDHYAIDISLARRLLEWEPGYRLERQLAVLVDALKRDPEGWYRDNGIDPPP